ncbi:MAG TPA: D-aminoacylase [Thermoanaerobaculia bacterium]
MRRLVPLLLLLLPTGTATAAPPVGSCFLIRDVTLVDGTGTPGRAASVRVCGDRIAAVGQLQPRDGERIVAGKGQVLAPGFIDTHSHHDDGFEKDRPVLAAVSQGVTTVVVGQDGGSSFPLGPFFAGLEARPVAVNVASYVGHGTLRSQVMGSDFRRPATADEIIAMSALLRRDLASGALGLSSGLEYDPGIYSTTDELLALARETSRAGGRYISHIRSEDRKLFEAIDEIIRIGREARLPVQVSHMKLAMKSLWGQADRLLARLNAARADGVEITADVYPYPYWQSTMTVLFPERNFTDRETAAFALSELTTPEGMIVSRFEPEPAYAGKTLAEIAALRGTDPVTTYIDLIAKSLAAGGDNESIIATSMDERDIAAIVAWPSANICSDGEDDGRHPRGYGTFPRVLRRYVREQRVLTLEAAVQKMTQLAALHMGLHERGVIREGAYADLVLFDPAAVADRATPQEPHLAAAGILGVWVNGVEVYDGEKATGAFPGRVLRR